MSMKVLKSKMASSLIASNGLNKQIFFISCGDFFLHCIAIVYHLCNFWTMSIVKSAVRSLPSCWNCPHALYRLGFGKFAIKDTDGPPRQLETSSTSSAG